MEGIFESTGTHSVYSRVGEKEGMYIVKVDMAMPLSFFPRNRKKYQNVREAIKIMSDENVSRPSFIVTIYVVLQI